MQYILGQIFTSEDIGLSVPDNDRFLEDAGVDSFFNLDIGEMAASAEQEVTRDISEKSTPIDQVALLQKIKPYIAAEIRRGIRNSGDQANKISILNGIVLEEDSSNGHPVIEPGWSYFDGKMYYNPKAVATNNSLFNIVSAMGHEIGHSLDPCTYSPAGPYPTGSIQPPFPYESVIACLRDPRGGNAKTFEKWLENKISRPSSKRASALYPRFVAEYKSFGGEPNDWYMNELNAICLQGKSESNPSQLEDILYHLPPERLTELRAACPPLQSTIDEMLKAAPPPGEENYCSRNDQIGEAFADVFGIELTANHIEEITGKTFTQDQYRAGFANMARDLCQGTREDSGFFNEHPAVPDRFALIMAHPVVRRKMGCEAVPSPRRACTLANEVAPQNTNPPRIER
jgi:hypothetical protein